jgi:hypothetical protein
MVCGQVKAIEKTRVFGPRIPDFLSRLVALCYCVRISLKESRTRGPVQSCVQEIRGISLVFREMWDTAGLPLKPVAGPTNPSGCPCSHQRTWAENDFFRLLLLAD